MWDLCEKKALAILKKILHPNSSSIRPYLQEERVIFHFSRTNQQGEYSWTWCHTSSRKCPPSHRSGSGFCWTWRHSPWRHRSGCCSSYLLTPASCPVETSEEWQAVIKQWFMYRKHFNLMENQEIRGGYMGFLCSILGTTHTNTYQWDGNQFKGPHFQ